jgi:glucosamine--fructose-6-phosphate aminotransferase (isomerizing)
MCGIVGYIGRKDATPILMEGLRRLEYRGYDSAGIALVRANRLKLHKSQGKVQALEAALPTRPKGHIGIAHTRWATHGEPSDVNAHPHVDGTERIAVVHNGIIENAPALRSELEASGVAFRSETDTEVLAHLIARTEAASLEDAVRSALQRIQGAYGIAVIANDQPDRIIVARNGSPVILGVGSREMFVASDAAAIVRHTQQVVYLNDGEVAVVSADGFETSTLDAAPVHKTPVAAPVSHDDYDKAGHDHYMIKEIAEQPDAVRRMLQGRLDTRFNSAHFGGLNLTPRELIDIKRIKILGCGSAYIASCNGAYVIEQLARIPASAEPASEFRYRNPVIEPDTLYVAVSQSGETLDTLMAVEEIKRKGGRVIGVINVVGSTIARACDGGLYLHAGPEIAVVSTKTFTSTLVGFALLGLYFGRIRDLAPTAGEQLIRALQALPNQIQQILDDTAAIETAAKFCAKARDMYFIGRGLGFPVAQEGALKLKEVSYIHAEAYPASELKHGPLALVTPKTPIVSVLPDDGMLDKNLSSIAEVHARKGPVIALTHPGVDCGAAAHQIIVPKSAPELDPILLGVALQIMAYHCALILDRDIDQPRNLAKSVTVE